MVRNAGLAAAAALVLLASCQSFRPKPVKLDRPEALLREGRFEEAAAACGEVLREAQERGPDDSEAVLACLRVHLMLYASAAGFERIPADRRGAYVSAKAHLATAARHAVHLL
ncbi:MAG: hypothetical protein ACYTAF_07580, partial [Planctomycetota bacterium]